MDCNQCKIDMVFMFDIHIKPEIAAEINLHLEQCPACSFEFENLKILMLQIKPRVFPVTPFSLKQNIIQQITMEDRKMKNKKRLSIQLQPKIKKILSIAAIIILILLVVPLVDKNNLFTDGVVKAANTLIENSIKATRMVKTMVIKFKVRTVAHDNFSLVGTEYPMVDHTIWKLFGNPSKWRMEKSGRVVVFDGNDQFLWIPNLDRCIKGKKESNFTEWLKILLDPEIILKKEQAASTDKSSKVLMEDKNGEIHLSVTSSAKGNFLNNYLKNKSIEESDNRREYVFDSQSKLLKGLKIFILEGTKETLILELTHIEYDVPVADSLFVLQLPEGIQPLEMNVVSKNSLFKNISSRKAAELFFEGLAKKDWHRVGEMCDMFNNPSDKIKVIKEYFGGLTVLKIGEPFKSGLYPGEFVPYEIKLPSGEIEKHNLALRNDNPAKVWMVDGGF